MAAKRTPRGPSGAADPRPTDVLAGRIEDQREEIFNAMAIIMISATSLDPVHDGDLRRVLDSAHDLLDAAALELNSISSAVARSEVAHGQA